MPIRVVSYGGKVGFWARIHFPKTTSFAYLSLQTILRKQKTLNYIYDFLQNDHPHKPLLINIETVNRCNGTCAFCPANRLDEKRPFLKMSDELFDKILDDLVKMKYEGVISLYINNEPFLDKRMPQMLNRVRRRLPKAFILVFTNGTVLTPEIIDAISGSVDLMYLNNYNDSYDLLPTTKTVQSHVEHNAELFSKMNIVVQRRYAKEYLANRAGTAPNKQESVKIFRSPCILPFTDMTIFPDGKVGLCCNDTLEKTCYGDLNSQSIADIFDGEALAEVREKMKHGRDGYSFCKHCDVIDSGIRLKFIQKFKEH